MLRRSQARTPGSPIHLGGVQAVLSSAAVQKVGSTSAGDNLLFFLGGTRRPLLLSSCIGLSPSPAREVQLLDPSSTEKAVCALVISGKTSGCQLCPGASLPVDIHTLPSAGPAVTLAAMGC